ncbi:MAG: tyrosine--tRNA ligase [Phycisphaerales bacterium]
MSENITTAQIPDLVAELEWRGLVKDATDKEALRDHLADPMGTPRKVYCGFDPTADSLTIGNLVPIMMLAHVKRAGHTPVVVMGGGTGLIGDPSGKSAERQMMTAETVQHHVNCQRPIFENVLGQIDGPEHHIKNNLDWLGGISYIEALRDIGKHFSVNMMMQKESVKERLNNREQGISYTEFSYMILQSYDFSYLYENEGITVQFGGSDQYGNIVAGTDLIRRNLAIYVFEAQEIMIKLADTVGVIPEEKKVPTDVSDALRGGKGHIPANMNLREQASRWLRLYDKILDHWDTLGDQVPEDLREVITRRRNDLAHLEMQDVFGLTAPLVQKADGGKFGKTETGAIWLTAARTSPYAYYQFWLNASDEDARNWIKVFTFLPQSEIEALIARHDENPGKRELQRTLAQQATTILHGPDAMENAEAAGKALFSGEVGGLDKDTLIDVFASVPTTEHAKSDLEADGVDPVELLIECNLASSKREAREFLSGNSVSINGNKIDADTRITADHLLHDSFIAIRRGKKKWHMTKWS